MKLQFSAMTTRQKVIAVIFAIVLVVLIWQIFDMLRSSGNTPQPQTTAAMMAAAKMEQMKPRSAPLAKKPAELTPREQQLMQMQQILEAKYVAALNELQMLKIEREIAENNKAITAAKLDTVASQKKIVNLLMAPAVPPGGYSPENATTVPPQPASYSVISVSQLRNRWSAVIGYQGRLYQVYIGDIMPPEGSKVVSIDRSGVWLEKDKERHKVSLVPAI